MSSNQRGPVYVFVALIGAALLCLCVVAVGVGGSQALRDFSLFGPQSAGVVFPTPTSLPLVVQPAQQPDLDDTPTQIVVEPGADVEPQILRAVYRKVNPSVVKVENLTAIGDTSTDDLLPQGQGSGFVWDASGLIVTNAHVVEGAREVRVIFSDDRSATGQVLGADPNSDIAVIDIDDQSGITLTPVERADIDSVAVGDRAIAIGAPFDFAGSMTVGTVSGLGRSIRSLNIRYTIPEVIQTDAPINPGNSGGPLLNSAGQVIGINAQIRTDEGARANSGVGFAIPIYIAERVVPSLVETGSYEHPFIGVSGQTYSPEWSEALGFPPDVKGAYLSEVISGYPADDANLRGASRDTDIVLDVNVLTGELEYLQSGGDLVIGINDRPVERFDDLLIYLFRYASPGDTVQLSVLRPGGEEVVIPVVLGVRPEQ
jgi:2-alkenal reductase